MEQMTLQFDTRMTFAEYDELHPDIWREFEQEAMALIAAGVRHYGAKAIMEVVRFHRTIHSTDGEVFRINNNYTSGYARKFHQKHPAFEGFFEIRERA